MKDDGEVTTTLRVLPDHNPAHISRVATATTTRGRGYAGQLLTAASASFVWRTTTKKWGSPTCRCCYRPDETDTPWLAALCSGHSQMSSRRRVVPLAKVVGLPFGEGSGELSSAGGKVAPA